MEALKEQLSKLRTQILHFLERIEGSSLFEKLVLRYEALDSRQQEWIKFLGRAFAFVVVIYLLFSPLMRTFFQRNQIESLYSLSTSVKQFNSELAEKKQGYITPQGWTRFEASDLTLFQEGLTNYLAQIGISEDFFDIQPQSNSLSIKITELSIRQLTTLSFQIDGFFPLAYFSQFQVTTHPTNKELLVLDAVIEYKNELASQMPQVGHADTPDSDEESFNAPSENMQRPPRRGTPGVPDEVAAPQLDGQEGIQPEEPVFPNNNLQPPPDIDMAPSFPGPEEESEYLAPEIAPPPDFSEGNE